MSDKNDHPVTVEPAFLLMKRGLFYRPGNAGYTGIKAEAGRYNQSEADEVSGVTAIHENDAPMYAPACWEDVKVKHLLRIIAERDRSLAALASAPAGKLNRESTARRIKELMDERDGFWRACSGCQESCDGYVPERDYPFDPLFRCQPGGGCSECGGIGVLWDDGRGYEDITGNEDPILIEEEPILIERRADAECGCPEELWEAYGAHLHMHLNAGSASNAHADFGDGGEVECEVTATTVDLARAAFFGWAKALQGGRP